MSDVALGPGLAKSNGSIGGKLRACRVGRRMFSAPINA